MLSTKETSHTLACGWCTPGLKTLHTVFENCTFLVVSLSDSESVNEFIRSPDPEYLSTLQVAITTDIMQNSQATTALLLEDLTMSCSDPHYGQSWCALQSEKPYAFKEFMEKHCLSSMPISYCKDNHMQSPEWCKYHLIINVSFH